MHRIGLRQVSNPEEKNSKNRIATETHTNLHLGWLCVLEAVNITKLSQK